MAVTVTQLAAYLKERYAADALKDAIYEISPFLGSVRHTRVTGKSWSRTIRYSANQSSSTVFSTAQTNSGRTSASKFTKSLDELWDCYTVFQLEGKALAVAPSVDDGAMIEAVEEAIEGATNGHNAYLAFQLFRDGGGALGQIEDNVSYPVTGPVAKLVNIEDAFQFEKGMVCQFDDTDGSSRTGSAHTGTLTVDAVDRDNGLITFNADLDTIGDLAVEDYIFKESDFGNCMNGLLSWHPWTPPTSGDSFFGIDRSVDVQRHTGSRVAAGSLPVREALIKGMQKFIKFAPLGMRNLGRMEAYVNTTQYEQLLNEIESMTRNVKYAHTGKESRSNASVSYYGLRVESAMGSCMVMPDPLVPANHGFLLDPEDYELVYSSYDDGPCTHIVQEDGTPILRAATSDSVEGRVRSYSDLFCRAPSKCVHLNFGV